MVSNSFYYKIQQNYVNHNLNYTKTEEVVIVVVHSVVMVLTVTCYNAETYKDKISLE